MTPIQLNGKNLGERHHFLNRLVNETQDYVFTLDDFPNKTPIDRIFKINLASKFRNVNYIIRALEDDDILYVSKALKCKWLLEPEYKHIIDPNYLEANLYPLMVTTAVTKMKNWLYVNLKDEKRCQEFYQYYYETNFKLAIKFLKNSSEDFILKQFPRIMYKISISDFKALCEKNSRIVKIFFDSLATDEVLVVQYLDKEKQYFRVLMNLLKVDPELVLEITEKYFNKIKMTHFSAKLTKFIMKYYKNRYLQKPELYTAFLLDLSILANSLTAEEATDLVIKLARDQYLTSQKWFSYKKVEPLIRRLKPKDRGAFKKKVFIDNDIGDKVKEWPYQVPSSPVLIKKVSSIFEDYEYYSNERRNMSDIDFRCMLKKRKYAKWGEINPEKTMLDKLFEEYRVASFDKTLFELRKRLTAESSAQNRQYMMLVLVSKSGGHEENVYKLILLLCHYINEPCQVRAAIVRSLVNRAQVWKIHEETWKQLLKFAHGLGLDDNPPETTCIELIHAAVIRQMLKDHTLEPALFAIFMDHFSTLVEYRTSSKEKDIIIDLLSTTLFVNACAQTETSLAVCLIDKLLDTLTAFKVPLKSFPGLFSKIEALSKRDVSKTKHILIRFFKARIARRELFEVNIMIMESEDSYLNILHHNIDFISVQALINVILNNKIKYQRLLRKISIYFGENDGLATEFLTIIKAKGFEKALARPLAILIGNEFGSYLKNVDEHIVDQDKIYAAALRANAHLPRPRFNIDTYGWNAMGAKAVANRIMNCRHVDVNTHIENLIRNKLTIKLGLILATRGKTDKFLDVFTFVAAIKPSFALKFGLNILRRCQHMPYLEIWNIIQPLMENLDITSISKKYLRINYISSIPMEIRPMYSIIVYRAFKNISSNKYATAFCYIENHLSNVDEEFIESILLNFFSDFLPDKIHNNDMPSYVSNKFSCRYFRILVKFLLLCKNEAIQNQRLESIGAVFFRNMETWRLSKYKKSFKQYLDEVLIAFRYHKVFQNTDYVCCLPVMKQVVSWMKSILPIETYFTSYAHMHLNMLYYKAIRKTTNILKKSYIDGSNPEVKDLVGNIFGNYIAREVNDLKSIYFASVPYLYKDIILILKHHFIHCCEIFIKSLINGILNNNKRSSHILGIYLLKETSNILKENDRTNILSRLKETDDIEIKMILFAEISV